MIKEYIQNLPGGKEYIGAQVIMGMVAGALFMISTILSVAILYIKICTNYSVDTITAMVVGSGIVGVILSVGGLISYYSTINIADNKYMSKIEEIRKQ